MNDVMEMGKREGNKGCLNELGDPGKKLEVTDESTRKMQTR